MIEPIDYENLLREWGISSPIDLKSVSEEAGINSQNWIVESADGKYLLKKCASTEREAFLESVRIQDYCAQKGAPVPKVLHTRKQRLAVENQNDCFALMEYISSKDEWSPDRTIDQEALLWIAHSLAQLHIVLRDCPIVPTTKPSYRQLAGDEINAIKNTISKSHDGSMPPAKSFDRRALIYFELSGVIPSFGDELSPAHSVHLDCHAGNVCVPPTGIPRIIDFGHIQVVPRMLAISFCCHRFAAFDGQATLDFLTSYSATDPLQPFEIDHHWNFLVMECSRRINHILRGHFFENDLCWDFELPRQLEILREAAMRLNWPAE